ncbi:MAG: cytochrome c oxidase subunit II [Actinomycetota bacterium]
MTLLRRSRHAYSRIGAPIFLLSGACAPQAGSSGGRAVNDLYDLFFLIAAVIFVIVTGLIAWSIIRYREKPGDDELPRQINANIPLEVLWFAIPTVIVVVLFVMSFGVLNEVNEEAPSGGDAVVVNVEGFQWGWRFSYENGPAIESLPGSPAEIVVPVDRPVTFFLDSPDVIHSFYIPRFLLKRDVVPGQTNRLDVTIDDAGSYGGVCAEFCGLLHHQMDFTLTAVDAPEFEQWLNDQENE